MKRQKRSNYNGQEEMCSALWDYARDVLNLGVNHSFLDSRNNVSDAQLAAVGRWNASQRAMATAFWRFNDPPLDVPVLLTGA